MKTKDAFDLFLALVVLGLALSGCFTRELIPDPRMQNPQATLPAVETLNGPRLRIQNTGTVDIKDLTVFFPDSQIHFGDVPAGATTAYQPAPKGVYNYGAYSFDLNGQITTQPVIDWVGESPRPGLSFTYVIDYNPARRAMQMIRLIRVLDE